MKFCDCEPEVVWAGSMTVKSYFIKNELIINVSKVDVVPVYQKVSDGLIRQTLFACKSRVIVSPEELP